ncbi:MAG: EAL domain-containing protein, partial [Acidimicrobiia bacterium]|nr:EAL domain-containing protein [Acidimicrobiia bacterium]
VHYQPIVDLGSDRVERLEALVRWRHPTRGLLGPGDFLGLAERAGLVSDILRFVLGDALGHAKSWRAEGLADRVSVNLSSSELSLPRLHLLIADELRAHGVAPEVLELEVAEDSLGLDLDQIVTVLGQLRLLGARLAIDDYGSGPGSLTFLRRLPVSALKLDRAFVTALAVDPENQAIVHATGELARALGLELVAEGVEAPSALPILHELGCHAAQGVAICPPMVPAQMTQWLRRELARHTAEALHR